MANLYPGTKFFMARTSTDFKKSEAMLFSFSFDKLLYFRLAVQINCLDFGELLSIVSPVKTIFEN